jgi:hypothetical protein
VAGDFSSDFSSDFNVYVPPQPVVNVVAPVVIPCTVYSGAASVVAVGGTSVIAIYGQVLGGFIQNPASATNQGIATVENLYVDLIDAAGTSIDPETFVLAPGEYLSVPSGTTLNIWVNAATSGHKFSCVMFQPVTQHPPSPQSGTFPPSSPTSMVSVIPSYVYEEYSDDDDVQAFFAAYNAEAQSYIDGFNNLNLPVYTGVVVSGALLDWVGNGLYGVPRPSLSSGTSRKIGLLNTYEFNSLKMNVSKTLTTSGTINSSDDVYKRVITWGFFKGDGKILNARWLKRRIMRFLYGTAGENYPVSSTYPVSITFGVGNAISITLVSTTAKLIGGALMNRFKLNTTKMNHGNIQVTPGSAAPNSQLWKEAATSGACELPFQFNYTIVT